MRKVFSLLTAFAILISMVVVPTSVSAATTYWTDEGIVATAFAGGSGTEADPYEIATASQLAKIAADANSSADGDVCSGVYYELTADIDLAGHDWVPIANATTKYFSGKILGNGHTIKNMTITCSYGAIGFIGSGSDDTVLSDLGFINANISYNNARYPDGKTGATRCYSAATVIAYVRGGSYTNIFVRDSVVSNNRSDTSEKVSGGFAGAGLCQHEAGSSSSTRKTATFTNCYVSGTTVATASTASVLFQGGFIGIERHPDYSNLKHSVKYVFDKCYTADITMQGPNNFAFMYFQATESIKYLLSATDVYSTNTNTAKVSQGTEPGTIGTTKDAIKTALVDNENYCKDNGAEPINGGYPVLLWEKTWEDPSLLLNFNWSDVTNQPARKVTGNLTLPETVTVDGESHTLVWTSSDTSVIGNDGTVVDSIADKKATLTVKVESTGDEKTFEITVLGGLTKALINGLGGQSMDALTTDITLPLSIQFGGNEYPVEWRTADNGILTADGKVVKGVKDRATSLTAYVNGEKYRYDFVVVADSKRVYVNESFDAIANGTDISGYTGWTNPVGEDGNTAKGVNYTVETDPTNESNKVIKVERYYGINGSSWYLNGVQQTGVNGPSRREAAMFVVDGDPDTDGNQPITSGKIQISAKMMFGTGDKQRMTIWIDDLGKGWSRSCIDFIFHGNARMYLADTYNTNEVYLPMGANATYEWYDVVLVLDLDTGKYETDVTREDGITYKHAGNIDINPTTPASVKRIGIHSRTSDDLISAGTMNSVWYVDDFSVKDITISDADAVAYAKKKLSLQKTATADITLPLAGEENTTITWTTSDASVITKDGVVSFAKEDKTATLTATITKGNATDTKSFTVTVSGRDAYEIKGIVVKTADTTAKELVADGEITAVEILNNYSKSAKMYVALYKDGRFEIVSTADLKSDAQSKEVRTVTLDTPIELPSDINGYEARVFVWDNMTPLAEVYYSDMPDTTLWMLGDSIMTIYADTSYPQTGWGMVVGDYLSEKVTIENHAHGGWTTATYLDSTSYDALAKFVDDIEEGDYAVIGLGINDSNERNNVSVEQYEANYREIAQAIIDRGATPILTTTTITTNATETAPNLSRYGAQKEVVKKVAGDMGLVCIDISTEMAARINAEITAGATMEGIRDKYYVWDPAENGWDLSGSTMEPNKRDGVHINLNGAKLVADIFADLLKVSTSKLGAYVK